MSHAPEHSSAPAESSVAELMTQLSEQTSRLTAAVHGIIFSVVKTLIDRGGARAFQRWSGEWPGH
jgi:hypothetical protein